MKIRELLAGEGICLSFEVFPPKTDATYESVQQATEEIAALHPSFMSVTYGAGGGTSKNTVRIASHLQNDCGVTALAHLTCASSSRAEVKSVIGELQRAKIENILALRGDIPDGSEFPRPDGYQYACELVADIRRQGDFCIGAACYPEGHVESVSRVEDIAHLKEKVDAGVDFLTTQMFFDNSILYNYLYRIREAGIVVPVIAGIMPVTRGDQMKRICALSGTELPARFKAIVDRFGQNPAAMQQAGIAYATDQIIDLIANGIRHIHVYSMNKPQVARKLLDNLSEIVR